MALYLIKQTFQDGFEKFIDKIYRSQQAAERTAAEQYRRPKTKSVEVFVIKGLEPIQRLQKPESL